MANTATVTSINTLRQRNLIGRAWELKALIDGAKDELDTILDQFKELGDGDFVGRENHKIQVRTSERSSLDTKIVKGFLTPSEIQSATKFSVVVTAKVL